MSALIWLAPKTNDNENQITFAVFFKNHYEIGRTGDACSNFRFPIEVRVLDGLVSSRCVCIFKHRDES